MHKIGFIYIDLFSIALKFISVTEEDLRNAAKLKCSFVLSRKLLKRNVYYLVTSLGCGDDWMDELAQASATTLDLHF